MFPLAVDILSWVIALGSIAWAFREWRKRRKLERQLEETKKELKETKSLLFGLT